MRRFIFADLFVVPSLFINVSRCVVLCCDLFCEGAAGWESFIFSSPSPSSPLLNETCVNVTEINPTEALTMADQTLRLKYIHMLSMIHEVNVETQRADRYPT